MVVSRGKWQELVARAQGERVPGVEVSRQVASRIARARARPTNVLHTPTLAACAGVALVVALAAMHAGQVLGGAGDELGPVMEFLSLYTSPIS